MTRDVRIRNEAPDDRAEVLAVIGAAFGTEPEVVALWDELREIAGTQSLVAVDGAGDEVVGHVGLTPAWVDAPDRTVEVLVLSPLSVRPDRQGVGIGAALVSAAHARADELGSPALFLEGDPAYYSRHGFRPARGLGFTAPSVRIPGAAFQVMLLGAYEPSVAGALVYPDVFWRHDAVGLRGEALDRFTDD